MKKFSFHSINYFSVVTAFIISSIAFISRSSADDKAYYRFLPSSTGVSVRENKSNSKRSFLHCNQKACSYKGKNFQAQTLFTWRSSNQVTLFNPETSEYLEGRKRGSGAHARYAFMDDSGNSVALLRPVIGQKDEWELIVTSPEWTSILTVFYGIEDAKQRQAWKKTAAIVTGSALLAVLAGVQAKRMMHGRDITIVKFYGGRIKDSEGRSLDELLKKDDEYLEDAHDYIQWMFPTVQKSSFNVYAPELPEDAIYRFRNTRSLRKKLKKSLHRMNDFYGLKVVQQGRSEKIVRNKDTFEDKAANWLTPGNHNFLRMTRIITSLKTLGLEEESAQFFNALDEIYKDPKYKQVIGARTYKFWRAAAESKMPVQTPDPEKSED